ncbi:hypothetical protein BH23GEM7_BH23GEM7_30720 [soil metagenome]|nr:hypothetical protein [Gemmatimonadota bacterium]
MEWSPFFSMVDESRPPRGGQDPSGTERGDKVRVRSDARAHGGTRGVVREVAGDTLLVEAAGDGLLIRVPATHVTNFSLAARRAWEVMPKRTGRPPLREQRKRMASFRLDVEVQEMLDRAVEKGLISNKSEAVNRWLRERLEALLGRDDPEATAGDGGAHTP